MSREQLSSKTWAVATEWREVNIRVVRRGDNFALEISAEVAGETENHIIQLPESDCHDLENLWLTL